MASSVLELRIIPAVTALGGDRPHPSVQLLIDGADLREIVRRVELPFAAAEGHPDLAGNYTGLPPEDLVAPSRHLLGHPSEAMGEYLPKVPLYGCVCGSLGCWPLLVRVNVENTKVTWTEFENPWRFDPEWTRTRDRWQWDLSFEFDLSQYEQAIRSPSSA